MKKLLLAILAVCFVSPAWAAAPTFNWVNEQDNSFPSSVTTTNVGSTAKSGACGTITAGDILIASLTIKNELSDSGLAAPSGWLQIGSIVDDGVNFTTFWYKIAGVGEVCSYTFTWTNANASMWTLVDYAGAASVSPVDASLVSSSNTGTTTVTFTGVSPASTPDVLIIMCMSAGFPITTDPAGMTPRVNALQGSSGNSTYVADVALVSSGSTGAKNAVSLTGAFQKMPYLMVTLRPPAAPGGTTKNFMMTGE